MSASTTRIIINSQTQQYIQKCFYAKRLVSKRVYDKLKREKVSVNESYELFQTLSKSPINKPVDTLKPFLAKALVGVEKYLSPNLSSQRSITQELDQNEKVNNELMELVDKIKYYQPASSIENLDFQAKSKVKAPTAKEIIQKIRKDEMRQSSLAPPEEMQESFNTRLLKSKKTSKSRFFYKAGPGSPLYDFTAHQLKEINILEQKSIQIQKEKEDYAKLNKTKEDFASDMNKLYGQDDKN
ncbi:hypothetical protein RB653_003617 [Dictyostelium firmibasis]|uniref:Uncharacterized protein n=1 Tax=Dictyostelium firmibasis TaxID=79012 RepID=A0AAN7Z2N4_9MYCE